MKLIQSPDLDLLLTQSTIEECVVIETKEHAWTFVLSIRNHKDGSLSEYRLVSQRGRKREWSDPRAMFRFLRDHYNVQKGHFQLR
ncbi:hypothetical protein VDS34_17995 [Xanthomonas campestris pv. campestris]|nr:hypothetical protein [Xanthomonas campestris]MCC5091130.1 hypothetical protein [Xanthomonas campestris]MCF8828547.1 hypothetical protein [Xanthomonas campestris pv. raphani]MDM7672492.1 hypothetical protein [Xanthomonas campestris pv. campestris]MDM7685215.1 hypothetical protein [Xanthomonas campestris pv. campestris]MDM7693435.1 hypothetical protein [Xanthomonas campestris pv. campestris]